MEDIGAASVTGSEDKVSKFMDDDKSTHVPVGGDASEQRSETSGPVPDLVSVQQKAASDFDKTAGPVLTNGDTAGGGVDDAAEEFPEKWQSAQTADLEDQQGTQSDNLESKTEMNAEKPDSESESGQQNAGEDATSVETAAASVKESDVSDECLASPEQQEEWMDILGNGQLKKKVLKEGKAKTRPIQSSLVKIKVTGQLENGVCIQDSTESFILGDGDVIPAIDMSVALMNEEETAEVITAPRFAYDKKGREPDIPGDSTLTLTLELLDVQPGIDITKLTAEERLQWGETKRERGNALFERQDFSGAINSYSKAVKFVDSSVGGLSGETSLLQKILDTRLKCYNNMAASQLKVDAFDAAIRSCEEVLKSQPENIKALYRLGKALSSKGQTEKAVASLKKAIKLDPESKLLHRELASLTQKQKKEVESEKTMYKRMMGGMADAAHKQKEKSGKKGQMWKWSLVAGGVVAAAASLGVAYFRSTH